MVHHLMVHHLMVRYTKHHLMARPSSFAAHCPGLRRSSPQAWRAPAALSSRSPSAVPAAVPSA